MSMRTVLIVALLPASLAAQTAVPPTRVVDSTVITPTYARTQLIYDSAGSRMFRFVPGNLLGIAGSAATELQITFLRGDVARIVAGTWGSRGKYGSEFYFAGDTVLFTFDSFEFVSDSAPPSPWLNFRAIPAWERRVFWRDGRPAFAEGRGRPITIDAAVADSLLTAARRLLRLARERR